MPRFSIALWASLAVLAPHASADAQWFGGNSGCNTCNTGGASFAPPPMFQSASFNNCGTCAPVQSCEVVQQPIMQTCYQTVPVTEYQQVKQTVKRPIVETRYVEQPVTEYVPVTEQKTCEVPTVSYQNVTEMRTQTRNMGYWVTNYQPNCKVSPCERDSRPGMAGWWNRTTQSARNAFTPAYTAQRQYVAKTCVQTVPVTRQVAIQGTRQVAYNVTTMVAKQSTRKVAVNEVRYVDEEVTAMRPITVMRTVPIGSQMAFAPMGGGTATAWGPVWGGPQTVLAPTVDPNFSRSATDIRARSANRDELNRADPDRPDNRTTSGGLPASKISLPVQPQPTLLNGPTADVPTTPAKPDTTSPKSKGVIMTASLKTVLDQEEPKIVPRKSLTAPTDTPSIVRAHRWVARTSDSETPPATVSSTISMVDADR